ncbi:GHKL domain-containing protein [Companilactobacillus hulinensis]|uniref:GHKL domain-containing protein n=1 Tax=Companilactobacillus hulinensis TaxID=2486007 RepID=UPI0013DE55F2|nr:GHKL domain-containing protein [Companilactobacillus hulinensis]
MVPMDTDAYIVENFLLTLIQICTFLTFNKDNELFKFRHVIYYLTVLFTVFIGQIFVGDVVTLVYICECFVFFKSKAENKYLLLENILLSVLVTNISNILSSIITFPFISSNVVMGYKLVAIDFVINCLILIVVLVVYIKYHVEDYLGKHESITSSMIMFYIYLTIFFFISVVQKFKAYRSMNNLVISFVIIQSLIMLFIFLHDRRHQEKKYHQALIEEQINNLEIYTQSLESEQKKLREFKHDYRNMLISLRGQAEQINDNDFLDELNKFEDYSNDYFKGQFLNQYKDIVNVDNKYLKSLLISKFHRMSLKGINCTFECRNKVKFFSINIYDLIRLLGIAMDNAIEAVDGQELSSIKIGIVLANNGTIFVISNSLNTNDSLYTMIREGYSTKKNHSGIGLNNFIKIRNEYPNIISTKYEVKNKSFNLELLIKDEGIK